MDTLRFLLVLPVIISYFFTLHLNPSREGDADWLQHARLLNRGSGG